MAQMQLYYTLFEILSCFHCYCVVVTCGVVRTCVDILAADRQTASEIEFDLRRFEDQEAAERQAAAQQQQHATPAPTAARPPLPPGVTPARAVAAGTASGSPLSPFLSPSMVRLTATDARALKYVLCSCSS